MPGHHEDIGFLVVAPHECDVPPVRRPGRSGVLTIGQAYQVDAIGVPQPQALLRLSAKAVEDQP